ncbi:MAG: hypothetical protein ABSC25_09930 [Roseiarcus sp.]|jgi:hypothetical protein
MSDGLVEDDFTNRPDDDELAFVHYEKLFRTPLETALAGLKENEQDAYWDSYNHFKQTYINSVLATVKALDLQILEYWINNPAAANEHKNFKQIKYDIDGTITEIKVRHAQVVRKASVRLEPNTREKIRELINKIKITIEAIEIPLPRKEALMSKLNAFAAEVDRDRTKFEAFGALMIEAAGVAGKVERKLRPIRKWIDAIANVMHEARAVEDNHPRLPAPDKRIETPTKQIAPPSGDLWVPPPPPPPPKSGDLDDDIPF